MKESERLQALLGQPDRITHQIPERIKPGETSRASVEAFVANRARRSSEAAGSQGEVMTEKTYKPGDVYRHHELLECPSGDDCLWVDRGKGHSPHLHQAVADAAWSSVVAEKADCACPPYFVAAAPLPFGSDGELGDVVKVGDWFYVRGRDGGWWDVADGTLFGDWRELTDYALRYCRRVQRYTKAERYTVIDGEVARDE